MAFGKGDKALVDLNVCTQVDAYIESHLLQQDQVLDQVLARCQEANLPMVQVFPSQGKFLNLLVRIKGAKRVLEIGTLGGYSSIWMARALPSDGYLFTIEYMAKHCEIAQANFELAGLANKIHLRYGDATNVLTELIGQGVEPFDFIFIDADKSQNPLYLELCLRLSHSGTVMVWDNVVRRGQILDANPKGKNVRGLQQWYDSLKNHPRLDSVALQTVSGKNWDGFAISVVK